MTGYLNHTTTRWKDEQNTSQPLKLIEEEPLSIRIQGKPYSVVMRTPGDEMPHTAGFCLGEGIVDTPDDIVSLAYCDDQDTNVVTVTLTEDRRKRISDFLDRRQFISQTSCGICGKVIVADLYQTIRPIENGARLKTREAVDCLEKISDFQPIRKETFGSHGAALYSADFKLLAAAEDVGRHNALDKAIGRLFLDRTLAQAVLLTLSSRISYELVQKAARARIPVVLAISRPTSLAVALAAELKITLACLARGGGLYVFCGGERLV